MQVVLRQHHQAAAVAAFERLHRESFGEVEGVLDPKLQKLLDKELADLLNRNEVQSARICERLESEVRYLHTAYCSWTHSSTSSP